VSVHTDSSVSVQKDEPLITLPAGFKLDTIQRNDTFSNTEIFISYPFFINGENSVNRAVKNQLLKEMDKILLAFGKPASSLIPSTIDIKPDYTFFDGNTLSYRFIIAANKYPALHPFAYYQAFNYDLENDRQIVFSNYFHLEGVKDSVLLRAVINKQIDRPADFGIPHIENVCFTPGKDSVAFYFDDNNSTNDAVEINRATVSKVSLDQFIRKHK